ncbi:MAG: hypothetical protein ACO3MW_11520, partial [Rhodospirillales bacterium]
MVRLRDLPETDQKHLLAKECPPFESQPWVTGPPLSERRVALITTAGLQRAGEESFNFTDTSYRVIPNDGDANNLLMSHTSVNFDRTGFQQDINVVFPIDRYETEWKPGAFVFGSFAVAVRKDLVISFLIPSPSFL